MDKQYSRTEPSPRYVELLALYKDMHVNGERALGLAPDQTFPGQSLTRQAVLIKKVMDNFHPLTVLDYGAGKGLQYTFPITDPDGTQFADLAAYWGVDSITCYDPGYEPFSTLPEDRYDAVISIDVLEHCPEEDLPWILDEIFGYARIFVFGNIASYPARKHLPNGENAHCTIQPKPWWSTLIQDIARDHASIRYIFMVESNVIGTDGTAQANTEVIAG
ncbi:MAG: class I SAM-dependent methyltransferase [Alphaproteobacteria bacterium]|jgi:hypothetical protein|nr:class I SAM-dependent methyltransferase [Alphaproteobacteria bacterium]MDP6515831.1 class I SAM-dependent methyltransferase [Alphaproteobacteria bacterium]